MNILLTGSTGFIGSNLMPLLRKHYNVVAPTRTELDLLDSAAVRKYFNKNKFDAIIHLANPTAQNPIDKYDELFERSLRVFTSLTHCNDLYGKMIYIGSGAEYGKHRAIADVTEEEFGQELPQDTYGLSRYIMSKLAEQSSNIINLRLFGCCGLGDPPYKLIQHIIGCIKRNEPIRLRQNTKFDFLYVEDIASVLRFFIENKSIYKAYNLCSGEPIFTGSIAEEVRQQMNSELPIVFEIDDYGAEYTGANTRLRDELPDWKPTLIKEAIRRILKHENR